MTISKTKLIITYLPQLITDNELKNIFQLIGPVKSAKIVRHKSTGYSYGCAFVEYTTEADAAAAIEVLNGLQIINRRIKVAFSRPGGEDIKSRNLCIRGIPRNMTEEEFESLMAPYGEIIQCRLIQDATTPRNMGIGHVLYDQRKQAEGAIKELHGLKLVGSTKTLIVKFAEDNAKKVHSSLGYTAPSMPGPVRLSHQGRFQPYDK